MNAETKSSSEIRYTLDVRIPKKLPIRMDVIDIINIGSDPRNDIVIGSDEGSSTKQFIFRMRANALIGINLSSANKNITLNETPMIEGKHYILEKGDSIRLNEIELIIRQDSTGHLAKGFDTNSNPKLQFLEAKSSENTGSQKIKKPGTSSLNIEEISKANSSKPDASKIGFLDKIKKLFAKKPKPPTIPDPNKGKKSKK